MYKRILSFLLVLIMLFSVVVIPAEAESVYNRQKKSIYFVMDDSGSMGGTPEYDANYSLQSLIAMCDKEDKVNLYFLNSNPNSAKKVDMLAKDNSVIQNIKTTYPHSKGGTPYDAVRVAQRELTDSVVSGDETEYWLVVLTDGDFDSGADPASELLAFSRTTLANGSSPHVLFISIGGHIMMQSQGTLNYLPGTDIIKTMSEAAKIISGRVEAKASYANGNSELSFNVPYPAKNIIVFTQNNEVKINSYISSSSLDISENYNVEYPVPGSDIKKSTVCFVREANNSSIGAGDVTFVFDKPLIPSNTVVLIEPAIGLVAHFYNQDGQEINPNDLKVGETSKVKFSLCDSETQQPLDESVFGSVNYYAKINGQQYDSNEFEFQIDDPNITIEMFAELPDGYTLFTNNTYPDLPIRRDIVFTLSNGGNFNADIKKLDETEGVSANILLNGRPVNETQINDFKLKIKGDDFFTSRFAIEKDGANGRFVIKPKAGFISPMTPYQKTYDVVLIDKDGSTYTATLNVEIPGDRDWLGFLLKILITLLIIWLICCQIFKRRLPFGTVFLIYNGQDPTDPDCIQPQPTSLFKLYWHEFCAVLTFKSALPLLHMLQYFFTPCPQKVMILKAVSGFDNFIFVADTKNRIYAKDKLFRKFRKNPEAYQPGYKKYDSTCTIEANAEHYQYGEILLSIGDLLYKPISEDFPVYVRFTTRKVLKRNPYSMF